MARYPGAEWSLLGPQTEPRIVEHRFWCLHTMVGSFAGTDAWFRRHNGAGFQGTESHFGVAKDGRVRQWQDTDFQADANGPDGGPFVLSIETEDNGAPDTDPWTPEQIEAIAKLLVWGFDTHRIPLERIPDTLPLRRGIGYHRQGVSRGRSSEDVDVLGNPWRVPSGQRWSTADGKICPGAARIRQVPVVVARAREIRAGLDAPKPVPQTQIALTGAEVETIVADPSLPVLRINDRSPFVGKMQALMRAARHEIAIDNRFGPDTHRQLADYQRARGLKPDSVCGPKTWTSLILNP